jgi:hypothetical protein
MHHGFGKIFVPGSNMKAKAMESEAKTVGVKAEELKTLPLLHRCT